MDGARLFPHGVHPSFSTLLPDASGPPKVLRRRDVPDLRYYIADFSLSRRFETEAEERKIYERRGADDEVPELGSKEWYDPFPVDVFSVGNIFRKKFVEAGARLSALAQQKSDFCADQKFTDFEYLRPLAVHMTQTEPKLRPTAVEAAHKLQALTSTLTWREKTRRLHSARETPNIGGRNDLISAPAELLRMPQYALRAYASVSEQTRSTTHQ